LQAENDDLEMIGLAHLYPARKDAIARFEGLRKQMSALETQRAQLATLTPRERQVFELVVRGKLNKQIAHELGPTERTIKAHRQRVRFLHAERGWTLAIARQTFVKMGQAAERIDNSGRLRSKKTSRAKLSLEKEIKT
jgi:DNA-binding CsgD family transcriptional regulator